MTATELEAIFVAASDMWLVAPDDWRMEASRRSWGGRIGHLDASTVRRALDDLAETQPNRLPRAGEIANAVKLAKGQQIEGERTARRDQEAPRSSLTPSDKRTIAADCLVGAERLKTKFGKTNPMALYAEAYAAGLTIEAERQEQGLPIAQPARRVSELLEAMGAKGPTLREVPR